MYLPNLIMASAFALLFFTMFSTNGPINSILMSIGILEKPIDFLGSVFGTRSLIGFMNFLMWLEYNYYVDGSNYGNQSGRLRGI